MRESHVGCVLYNGKDNHWQIDCWIQIMRNVRVLSNHERALLAHQCTFGAKTARFNISKFYVIKNWSPNTNDCWYRLIYIKRVVFRHLLIIKLSKFYRFHDTNVPGNHKYMASHYKKGNKHIFMIWSHCLHKCNVFIEISWGIYVNVQQFDNVIGLPPNNYRKCPERVWVECGTYISI